MAGRWRTSEDKRLRRLYAAGAPLAVIASELGRSEDAVGARRATLGLAPRRQAGEWSALADAVLREATRAGVPATELARRLRRPVEQVRARRRQLGLGSSARTPDTRRTTTRRFVRHWASGGNLDDLARGLGRTPERVAAPCPAPRTPSPGTAPAMDGLRGRDAARRLRRRPHMRRDRPRVDSADADGGRGAGPQARARELRPPLERRGRLAPLPHAVAPHDRRRRPGVRAHTRGDPPQGAHARTRHEASTATPPGRSTMDRRRR